MWEVEHTVEFEEWWVTLPEAQQEDVDAIVRQLEERGPSLPFPYSSGIKNSRHSRMRELRIQSGGRPIRILYVFDSRRIAVLLLGGDKTSNKRFYEICIPIADKLYDDHLDRLKWLKKAEGLL